MVNDVETIEAGSARLALRLCNFVTASAALLPAHEEALDTLVAPPVTRMLGPWVDLFGYASRRGSTAFNLRLSQDRLAAVRQRIATYRSGVNFQLQTAHGSARSTGAGGVEVYVYATKPAPAPSTHPGAGSTEFEIRLIGGGSASIGIGADNYFFQIVDLHKRQTAFFFYTGVGYALSPPKIPGPGSMTYAGPPTRFTTTAPIEIHQFNAEATLDQSGGATFGSVGIGGEFHLRFLTLADGRGSAAATAPDPVTVTGGSGISMPSFGSVSRGVLALVSDIWPFTGY